MLTCSFEHSQRLGFQSKVSLTKQLGQDGQTHIPEDMGYHQQQIVVPSARD